MENRDNNIIIFPDYEKLQEDIKRLKVELSMLLLARDELEFVVCRNIETAYYLKLGPLEQKVLEAQWSEMRLKRKIELIRAKLNRQEKVELVLIEKILDEEFAEFQQKLSQHIDKMNESLRRAKAECLSDEDNEKLKKMYRNVVKKLHPDLNPKATPAQIRLFETAVQAYKSGDLKTIEIIAEMMNNEESEPEATDAMGALREEYKRLEKLLDVINKSIEQLKSRYPYTLREYVEDEKKEAERRAELENILEQYNDMIKIHKEKIKEMLE